MRTPGTGFAAVAGAADIRSDPTSFLTAFARRVEEGLLQGASPSRNAYVVTRRERDRIAFRAASWWTAINVGLNDVEVSVTPDRHVRYGISYWRWTTYALVLSGVVGLALAVFFLMYDIRTYLAEHPSSLVPWLSLDQNVAIGWGMVFFWGFAWPWILTALHRRPLRRLMSRLIAEVDGAAAQR